MTALLRFTGSVNQSPAIAEWFEAQPAELRSIAQPWYECMRRSGPDVRELMHDGLATVCVDAAPFAYVGVFKAHVNVGFFHGDSLPDPANLLEGSGKFMRHVKLMPAQVPDPSALEALIASAYQDILVRVRSAGGAAS